MNGVDVLARLYLLRDGLDKLAEDDAEFVTRMVALNESGQTLNRQEILRIVDMAVPGEPPKREEIQSYGLVNVVSVSPDQKIWRYMPLEHLFALLSTKTLHFSPLSVMADIAEGQLPGRAWDQTKRQLPQDILEGRGVMDADTMMGIMVGQRRTDACLNCWYMDGSDSLKMWDEYAPRNGVAIESTVHRLGSALQESNTPVTIGPVTYFTAEDEEKYIDQAFYGSLYIKRDPFSHEKELRALVFRVNTGIGVDIPVERELLIGRLVLSPELKDWAIRFIIEAIRHFGFTGSIEKSSLTPSK